METRELKDDIKEKRVQYRQHADRSRKGLGFFLLIIGALYLAREAGVAFPTWFFSWPVLLMGIGLYTGFKHRFQNWGWAIPFAIGGIFLFDRISPDIYLKPYLWPIVLMAIGLYIIFRPRHRRFGSGGENLPTGEFDDADRNRWERAMEDGNDVIDCTAVFGGVKKNVLSKNFKGGEIVAVMGGAEINLTQSDFNGKVMVEVVCVFGGAKLIVPNDWEVQSNVVAIFGGVDDKRPPSSSTEPQKILYIDGTCIFGGLEIKSF